jgi:hypothetical protein
MKFLIPIMLLLLSTSLFAGAEGIYKNNLNDRIVELRDGKWLRGAEVMGIYIESKDGKTVILHATKKVKKNKLQTIMMKFEGKNLRHYSMEGKKMAWLLVKQKGGLVVF